MDKQPAYTPDRNALYSICIGILGVVTWIFPFSFILDLFSNEPWLKGLQNIANPYGFILNLVLGVAGILTGIIGLRKEPDNFPAMIGIALCALTILFTLPAFFIAVMFH